MVTPALLGLVKRALDGISFVSLIGDMSVCLSVSLSASLLRVAMSIEHQMVVGLSDANCNIRFYFV